MWIRAALVLLALATASPQAFATDLNAVQTRLFEAQVARAQKGDANDQYYLGEMYEQGLGTAPDMEQAVVWYTRAATKGNALAKRKLQELARSHSVNEQARSRAETATEQAGAEALEKARAGGTSKQTPPRPDNPKTKPDRVSAKRVVTPNPDAAAEADLEARRRAAQDAYEKARKEQQQAGGLWE